MSLVILVRHAHRDLSDPEADNGLSKKGKSQSRKILKYFKRRFGASESRDGPGKKGVKIALISSPKRRCVETLEPVARGLGKKLLVSDLLLEARSEESLTALRLRVSHGLRKALKAAGSKRGAVVLCSHGDWLPQAIEQLSGARAKLEKGALAEIEDGQLIRLLQPSDL